MNKYCNSKIGYVVFEGSQSKGTSERWFPVYIGAINYAISLVKEMSENFEENFDRNAVIVYEGEGRSGDKEEHMIPHGNIVFYWKNF